jgi:hypothetical protein
MATGDVEAPRSRISFMLHRRVIVYLDLLLLIIFIFIYLFVHIIFT